MTGNSEKITIVDYGVGNLRSLIRAFEHFGANVTISEDPNELAKSAAIVLPGDGTFKAGIDGLKVRGLAGAVKDVAVSKRPVLGICLGAQILMSVGFEFGNYKGLSLIPGRVVKFPNSGEKIPHIGWNNLIQPTGINWDNTILAGVKPESFVYFIHSYIMEPKSKKDILANTVYGELTFASVVSKGNIYGCQFHPEKSGGTGLVIIKNFVDLIYKEKI